jgi:ELWxxDGT repeat protein/cysteine-rich repeat protein
VAALCCLGSVPGSVAAAGRVAPAEGAFGALVQVADIRPGPVTSDPSDLLPVGGRVYFSANDGTTGTELWRSDGTRFGTARVADLEPGPGSGLLDLSPPTIAAVGETVYFVANAGGPGLWRTAGTAASTSRIFPIDEVSSISSMATFLTPLADRVLLFLRVYTSVPGGCTHEDAQLVATDGTPAAQQELARWSATLAGGMPLRPCFGSGACCPVLMSRVGQAVLFVVGGKVWRTDGTAEGTAAVATIDGGGYLTGPTVAGEQLFFLQTHGQGGARLWRTDGTAEGTEPVAVAGSDPAERLAVAGSTLFFTVDIDDHSCALALTDGTTAGTALVRTFARCPELLDATDGMVVFTARDEHGRATLWRSDGRHDGTIPLLAASPSASAVVGSTVFFSVSVAVFFSVETQLWKTDGTPAGTVMVGGFAGGHDVPTLTAVDGTLFVAKDDGRTGREIWAVPVSCGDGRLNPAEDCDDGNVAAGDGCDALCRSECRSGDRVAAIRCELRALARVPQCRQDPGRRRLHLTAKVRQLLRMLGGGRERVPARVKSGLASIEKRRAALVARGRLSAGCALGIERRVRPLLSRAAAGIARNVPVDALTRRGRMRIYRE